MNKQSTMRRTLSVALAAIGLSALSFGQSPDVFFVVEDSGSPNFNKVAAWDMNGVLRDSEFVFDFERPTKKCVGVGDFDGDGWTDSVWFDPANRKLSVIFLVDGAFVSEQVIRKMPERLFVVGVGDADGDGDPDILMKNKAEDGTDNSLILWFIEDSTYMSAFTVGKRTHAQDNIVGFADVDGDGLYDILWRKGNRVSYWKMLAGGDVQRGASQQPNGRFKPDDFLLMIKTTDHKLIGAGDFNNDGFVDIMWVKEQGGNDVRIDLNDGFGNYNTVRVVNAKAKTPIGLGKFR